jgi:hypothetical protein
MRTPIPNIHHLLDYDNTSDILIMDLSTTPFGIMFGPSFLHVGFMWAHIKTINLRVA